MRGPLLQPEPLELAAERLAALKASPDCVPYCEKAQFGAKRGLQLSIYGAYPTREIFLEVTDGTHTRVKSFRSRLKNFPRDSRRTEMPLADVSDAFKLARSMTGNWPGHPIRQLRLNSAEGMAPKAWCGSAPTKPEPQMVSHKKHKDYSSCRRRISARL